MRPSLMMTAGGVPRAAYVGSSYQLVPNTGNTNLLAVTLDLSGIGGLQPGDYLMVFAHNKPGYPYGSISGAGWQQDNYTWTNGWRTSVYHRRITAEIIASPPVITAAEVATFLIVAYRGVGKAVRQSVTTIADGSAQITQPGFVPAPDSVGVLTYVARTFTDSSSYTPPATWTRRILAAGTQFRGAIADALEADDYVAGDPIQWTVLGLQSSARIAQAYDLRLNP